MRPNKPGFTCAKCRTEDTFSLVENSANSITWCINGHVIVQDSNYLQQDYCVYDFSNPAGFADNLNQK